MTQFVIPVAEYGSATPGVALPTPAPFLLDDRRLLIAMVRSMLTSQADKASRKYAAAIVWPTLQFLLDRRQASKLVISPECRNVFRDFSLALRIGEPAQGVSFAYWMWQRGYTWIADFNPWIKGLNPPYTGLKSPDYIMFNMVSCDLAVMEAKGTGSSCHKAAMGEALRQCRGAASHSAINRGFGTVLTLDMKNPSGAGALHIRDPESTGDHSDRLRHAVFQRSYASWFELAGEDEKASWCRRESSSEGFAEPKVDGQISSDFSRTLRAMVAVGLGFDPRSVSFSVDEDILKAITDFQAFQEMGWFRRLQDMKQITQGDRQVIRFPDGTTISGT